MGSHPRRLTSLAFSLFVLTSCGDEPTQPDTTADQTSVIPASAQASDTWVTRRPLPLERAGVATAVVPNAAGQSIVYVIGGYHPHRPFPSLARVEAYNVAANTWSRKRDLPVALQNIHGAEVIDGKLYVAGPAPNRGDQRRQNVIVARRKRCF